MEIFVPEDNKNEVLQDLEKQKMLKFVICSIQGRIMATVFPASQKHFKNVPQEVKDNFLNNDEQKKNEAHFVGAGSMASFEWGIGASWGSLSCFGVFGLDQPSDSQDAKQILQEFKDSFGEWKKKREEESSF